VDSTFRIVDAKKFGEEVWGRSLGKKVGEEVWGRRLGSPEFSFSTPCAIIRKPFGCP
jgi:hypothetical protein